jgi:hypothetical protein
VVATDPERLEDLLGIAEPLARRPARELILTRLLRDDGEPWSRTPPSPNAEALSNSKASLLA